MALFDLKILPIVSYEMEFAWDRLTTFRLETVDKLKADFMKNVLGVHRTLGNRLVFLLTGTTVLGEQLRMKHGWSGTTSFNEHCTNWEMRMTDIDSEFFNTPAMRYDSWKGPNCKARHRLTRAAMHGFHHLFT